jgi:hypothetical protein
MKASEVLMKAKALIGTPDKWCKGTYHSNSGGHCMIGSLFAIAGTGITETHPSVQYLQYGCTTFIWAFNDHPQTTHADVMAAFDKAIALALADERKDEPWTIEKTRGVLETISAGAKDLVSGSAVATAK